MHIIAPFDNDLCFVKANGLLKTLCGVETRSVKTHCPERHVIEIIQIYHMTQHPAGPPRSTNKNSLITTTTKKKVPACE